MLIWFLAQSGRIYCQALVAAPVWLVSECVRFHVYGVHELCSYLHVITMAMSWVYTSWVYTLCNVDRCVVGQCKLCSILIEIYMWGCKCQMQGEKIIEK